MDFTFDEEAQKLILEAKKEMHDLKHPYVGSEHLFLAILHSHLEVAKFLNSYGITYDKFRKELICVVGLGKKENQWFLFTPLLKRIIYHATYYSDDSSRVITPFSLLISLLQEGDGVANRILVGMDIDLEALQEKVIASVQEEEAPLSFLRELGVNMNEKSLMNHYDPVVGREKQILQLIQNLLRKNKNNPLLIGEAGVGKTAIVEELARRIALGNVPFPLKDKIIYSISMSQLVAGTKYRGEFEEKLHKLIDEVVKHPNIILFIDEVHTLMGAGGAEGAIDASNIVKPFLARGEIRIIGATTIKEYNDYIRKDKALDRRFQKIYIQEATREEVKIILDELKPIYEDFHHVILDDAVLTELIELSFSCLFVGRQPDKTIDFLDQVCSYASFHKDKNAVRFSLYSQKMNKLDDLKNKMIQKRDFEKASFYKKEEMTLQSQYDTQLFSKKSSTKVPILKEDLYHTIYQMMRVPEPKEWLLKVKELKKYLKKELIGQKLLIEQVLSVLEKYDYVKNNGCMSFLFIGKSGVGKTFFLDKLVEMLFDGIHVITINMSEFREYPMISKLVGSAPLFGRDESFLFQSIQENPFSVLILDKIDQANPLLLKQLLNAFSAGFIMDSYGEKIFLSKCIVFMTSSIGGEKIGFSKSKKESFSKIYSSIKHVYSFSDLDSTMIRHYLKHRLVNLDESLKRRILEEALNSDWKKRGFHAICECLEKETVFI